MFGFGPFFNFLSRFQLGFLGLFLASIAFHGPAFSWFLGVIGTICLLKKGDCLSVLCSFGDVIAVFFQIWMKLINWGCLSVLHHFADAIAIFFQILIKLIELSVSIQSFVFRFQFGCLVFGLFLLYCICAFFKFALLFFVSNYLLFFF